MDLAVLVKKILLFIVVLITEMLLAKEEYCGMIKH